MNIEMNNKRIANLPSPPSDGLLGHIGTMKSPGVHRRFQQWSGEFGGLYQIRLAHKKAVVVGQRHLLQQVIKGRPEKYRRYSRIESVFEELQVNGIFSSEGSSWRKQRELFNPAFNGEKLRYFFPTISRVTDQLVEKIRKIAEQEHVVDIKKLFTEYTVDTISNLAFAYDINSLEGKEKELHKSLSIIFPGINSRLASPLPLWRLYKTAEDRKFETALEAIKIFLRERIESTRKKLVNQPELKEKPENLLQALIVEQGKNSDFMDGERVLANAITIMLAGEDTTANSLSWLSYLLSTHDEIQEDLREEILSLPDGALHRWPLPRMPLMNACIHESMRIKPVAPLLYAEALEDNYLDELLIPKGTLLVLLINTMSNDKKCFEKPEEFNPYRWISNKQCKVSDMAPFGGGARVCPGRSLALLEIKLSMSRLLKEFTFGAVDSSAVKERFSFVMMPDNLQLRIRQLEKV